MLFEAVGNFAKLLVTLGHHAVELANGHGCADSRHHVLALRIDQELAVKFFPARGGIPREAYACSRRLAHIPEHHRLDVHRRSQRFGNLVHPAIVDCARIVPRSEHRADRTLQLLPGGVRKVGSGLFLHQRPVLLHKLFQCRNRNVGVQPGVGFFFDVVEDLIELALLDLQHDVSVHLNEPAIAVPHESLVACAGGESFHGILVEAKVEDRVHHAGHGKLGARSHRHEQWAIVGAELLPGCGFELCQSVVDLLLNIFTELPFVVIKEPAYLGADGETRRHGQARVGHLRQAGAFAS